MEGVKEGVENMNTNTNKARAQEKMYEIRQKVGIL